MNIQVYGNDKDLVVILCHSICLNHETLPDHARSLSDRFFFYVPVSPGCTTEDDSCFIGIKKTAAIFPNLCHCFYVFFAPAINTWLYA